MSCVSGARDQSPLLPSPNQKMEPGMLPTPPEPIVPCYHSLNQCLHDYIEAAGITDDVDGYLFRTARRKTGQLTSNPLFQQDAHRIIRRRAKAAGIETRIGNHTFRATGITAYLKNSGKLEVAQQIANHESPRTTKLYDRRQDEISLDEIERITI